MYRLLTLLFAVLMLGCTAQQTPTQTAPIDTPTPIPTPTAISTPEQEFGTLLTASGLSIADVVEEVLPSVVQVITADSTGSGFILTSDGLVVTNHHVVDEGGGVLIRLNNGDVKDSEIIHIHPQLDLAYVKMQGAYTPVTIRDF